MVITDEITANGLLEVAKSVSGISHSRCGKSARNSLANAAAGSRSRNARVNWPKHASTVKSAKPKILFASPLAFRVANATASAMTNAQYALGASRKLRGDVPAPKATRRTGCTIEISTASAAQNAHISISLKLIAL